MAEVVLDANVLVGYLDANDVQHARASALLERLEAEGHQSVLLDVLIAELYRFERVRRWRDAGEIEPALPDAPRFFTEVLDVIEATAGALNFNDGLLVVLQRNSVIDDVASFDEGFDAVAEFRRLA